jgi:hypothetical protein
MTTRTMPSGCGQAPRATRFRRRRASRTERAAMPTRYTVWVKNEQLGEKLVVLCDAPDVSAAIQQALEQAARNWECGTDIHSVYGIAEGTLTVGSSSMQVFPNSSCDRLNCLE